MHYTLNLFNLVSLTNITEQNTKMVKIQLLTFHFNVRLFFVLALSLGGCGASGSAGGVLKDKPTKIKRKYFRKH